MKKVRKILVIILTVIIFGGLFSGCQSRSSNQPSVALAIVWGNHANQNRVTEKSFEKIESLVERAVYGGEVSVIVADGIPRNIGITNADGSPASFEQDAKNATIKARRIKEYTQIVMDFLRSDRVKAMYPEVDILAAIKEAERTLRDSTADEKWLVLMDTGLSTAGRINLSNGNLNLDTANTSEFISSLANMEGVFPDLGGVKVCFVGLGDVAYPQTLPDTTFPKLQRLWEEIFVACGVQMEDLHFLVMPSGTEPNLYSEEDDGFPYVTVINFTPISISISNMNLGGEKEMGGELLLPDVGFYPDTADMVDEQKAIALLQPYADVMAQYLIDNQGARLYLVGTTATTVPGGEGDALLSQQRAQKLKDALTALGVPSDRLVAIGVGARVPPHLRVNEFRNGIFDSGLAQGNRKATVYEINNEDLQEILAFNGIDINTLE